LQGDEVHGLEIPGFPAFSNRERSDLNYSFFKMEPSMLECLRRSRMKS
jgi:hypothetical protein